MARLSKLCVLLLSALVGVNANNASPKFNVQQTKQSHDALLQALSSSDASSLSSIAAERAVRLQSLMLSEPNEALKLSEDLFAVHSSNQQLSSLQSSGHVESQFTSQSDLMFVCGQQYDDDRNKLVKYFCEESLYRYDLQKSFKVHVADDFPLIPQRSHNDVLLSGFQLNDVVVLKHSSHLSRASRAHLEASVDYPEARIPVFDVKSVTRGPGLTVSTINNAMLYINIAFPDIAGGAAPATAAQNNLIMQNTDAYFTESSYGLSTVKLSTTKFVDVNMPATAAAYGVDYNRIARDADTLALAQLRPLGQTLASYPLVVWQFRALPQFPWAGLGSVGGRGTWNNGNVAGDFATKVICHELGHNYGMMHAAAWKVTDSNPLSPTGANDEYGDTFDMMGYGLGSGAHYNSFYKFNLRWLPLATTTVALPIPTSAASPTTLTQRLVPMDLPQFKDGVTTIDLKRSNAVPIGDHYWLSFRTGGSAAGTGVWTRERMGLWIHTSEKDYGIDKTYVINTHVEYRNGQGVDHAALQVGETFSECSQNIHITNIGQPKCAGQTGAVQYDCVDVTVNRVTGTTGVLNIVVATLPTDVQVGVPVTLSASSPQDTNALITFNTVSNNVAPADTWTNIVAKPSVTTTFTTPGWKRIVVTATDLKGRATRFMFPLLVGTSTAARPVYPPAESWSRTCATGKVTGYVATFGGAPPAPTTAAVGRWFESGLGVCTQSCGGGLSTQIVECRVNGVKVLDSACATNGPKPAESVACNTQTCDVFSWAVSAYSTCSVTCGGGTQTRTVSCVLSATSTAASTIGTVVDNNKCPPTTKPAASQTCNTQSCVTVTTNCVAPNGAGICTSCKYGFAGDQCTIAPSVTASFGTAITAPMKAGDILPITWTSTGSATTVQLLLQSASTTDSFATYITRTTPSTTTANKKYDYAIPVNLPAGTYQIVVTLNVANIAASSIPAAAYSSTSASFNVLDSCGVINPSCYNGGTCKDGMCVCQPGFSGELCSKSICGDSIAPTDSTGNGQTKGTDIPRINPCNGGMCSIGTKSVSVKSAATGIVSTQQVAAPVCTNCPNGKTGDFCQNDATCALQCSNGGVPDETCTTCSCAAANTNTGSAWSGPRCATCSFACGANGVANSTCTGCDCQPGYTGIKCDTKYMSVTLRLSSATNLQLSPSFNTLLTNLLVDVAFVLKLSPSSLEVSRTTSSVKAGGGFYTYVVINVYPDANKPVTSSALASSLSLQSADSTSDLNAGSSSSLIDGTYGAKDGDVAPADSASPDPDDPSNPNNPTTASSSSNSTVIVIGIIVGVVVLVAIIVAVCVMQKKKSDAAANNSHTKANTRV